MKEYTIKDWKYILLNYKKNKTNVIKTMYPCLADYLDIITKFLHLMDFESWNYTDIKNNMNGLLTILEKMRLEDRLYLFNEDFIDFVVDESSIDTFISDNSLPILVFDLAKYFFVPPS